MLVLPQIASASSEPSPSGSWVGVYGDEGYDLAAWNGEEDLTQLPAGDEVELAQGSRYVWAQSTSDERALESPSGLTREAATYYAPEQLRINLKFNEAYSGELHLYAIDWDSSARRETISVDGQTAVLSSSFQAGAWISLHVEAAAGETLPIRVTDEAGANAVLSGIFLGNAGAPRGAGSAGATGATGATGEAGPMGVTGATGPTGATGAAGATGETGVAGAVDKGATGPAGSQGLEGAQGQNGAAGGVGPTGPAGASGEAGVTGSAGAAGTTGATGDNGATGTTGITGATGPTGASGVIGSSVICSGTASSACAATTATKKTTGNPAATTIVGPVTAQCATGDILLGGGASATENNNKGVFVVRESRPTTAGSGGIWSATGQVAVAGNAGTEVTITAYAICSS